MIQFASTILLLLFSLSLAAQKKEVAELYKTDIFEAAIFPAEYQDYLPKPRFTPAKEEINLAEIALIKDLESLNFLLVNQSDSPVIHQNLDKYCRQYFGYTDENGDRILLINFFWKTNHKEDYRSFLKTRVIVLDGGSFYWNVKYNLTKKKLFGLSVNGYA